MYEEPVGHKPRSPRVPNATHIPRLKRRGRLVMPIGLLSEVLDEGGNLVTAIGRDGETVFLLRVEYRDGKQEDLARVATDFIRQKPQQVNRNLPESYEVNIAVTRKGCNLPVGRWTGVDRLYLGGAFVGFRLYYIPGDGVSREEVKRPEIEQKISIKPIEIGWPMTWPNGGFISFHAMRRAIERSKVLSIGLCTYEQDLKLQEEYDNEEDYQVSDV